MTRLKNMAAEAVPKSAQEADVAIARIGSLQRERKRLETELNDKLAALKKEYADLARPHQNEIEMLFKAVQIFCEANRRELTRNEKVKFHAFHSGVISWRKRPPKVTLRGVAAIMEHLKTLGLERFIRTKEEINKEAMLAEPNVAASIEGVKIGSAGEDFVITPSETKLDEVA